MLCHLGGISGQNVGIVGRFEKSNILWDIGGWEKYRNYRIYGRHFPRNEIAEFRLEDAEVIPEEDFCDPECEKRS